MGSNHPGNTYCVSQKPCVLLKSKTLNLYLRSQMILSMLNVNNYYVCCGCREKDLELKVAATGANDPEKQVSWHLTTNSDLHWVK